MMRLLRLEDDQGVRRQWGADSHQDPMPAVPRTVSDWAMGFGRAAVVVTAAAWLALVVTIFDRQVLEGSADRAGTLATIGFLVAVTFLAASATAYLVGRLGFYYRARQHRRAPRAVIEEFFGERQPTLTALVPSYQEEPGVILMTLLATALQEYPDMRVVLLIDDPPEPQSAGARRLLASAEALPAEVENLLAEPRRRFDAALERFEASAGPEAPASAGQIVALAEEYERAAGWIRSLGEKYDASDHNERFFATHVLGQLAADLGLTGGALRSAATDDPGKLTTARLAQLYRRLAWTFQAEVTSFQRKRYASLSAEPNKAMNLNSYIGLMGGAYSELETPAGRTLVPAGEAAPDLVVPDSEYVLTVDADSVLMPEYCLRLVHRMELEESARVAVAQTPYSAFPGAATRLERIAGATTDLQHIIHQGMTYHSASFWVGANAVLRKSALDEIAETEYKGEFRIHRYISDRTVIEDTESTIDLAAHGWTLHNYPERLAYSATPPDFGSLCIQRQRWANGGLLILPKLIRCVRRRRERDERTSIAELLLRVNYMASVAWSSLFVLCLMVVPFSGSLLSPLTFAIAIPYFLAMAVDLRYCGYKGLDAARIYGFNLLLLPVNLAGSLSSVVQALTGAKGRFMRTPKVRDRTIPAFVYVVLPYALVAFSIYTFTVAWEKGLWPNAIFAALNGFLCAYAIVAFIGLRNSLVDIWINVVSWLYKPPPRQPAPARSAPRAFGARSEEELSDWELVLYMGHRDRRRTPREARPADPADPAPVVLALPVSAPVLEAVATEDPGAAEQSRD